MSSDPAAPPLRVVARTELSGDRDGILARCPEAEFTAGPLWCALAARHYPGAASLYLTAELSGETVGVLPVVVRSHHALVRLESSFDGTVAGPQVTGDLDSGERRRVAAALCGALADRVTGRTAVAAMTIAPMPDADEDDRLGADARWQRQDYLSAVVPCDGGIDHIERDLWTNNRRNERNRGLKRGCTLHATRDPDEVAAWYPLYLDSAGAWAQAPVPLGMLQELVTLEAAGGVLNLVRHEGEIIAGHVCFRTRDRLVAWQGAVAPAVQRTLFPTTLVYWQDLTYACEHGLAAVDFGGCVGRDSLWDFKRRCGARPEPRCQLVARSWLGRVLEGAARRWRGRGR